MNNKKITIDQMKNIAKLYGIHKVASLRAVHEVECRGNGFNPDDTPVILFERHVFRQRLIVNKKITALEKAEKERPDLCNKLGGGYGLYSQQHNKLAAAAKYDRTSALEACSWGIGQVMGYHWLSLGYVSLQAFINEMYKDEAAQLDAMCRYIKTNHLIDALNTQDWKKFARGYNGVAYAKNQYDKKLATAFDKFNEA
ncbi:N-acetylmuramidase family protein [Acinetobacter piscicola]|uniref:N-acetylmuramidase family protein n=1 Tax=Acinetobacter piscicola TaxID=2006115 RepID=UPI00102222A1|nr:N-acetylmuramidase family protein [Acinetobacter piscicola]RYL25908.1 N-acetylmuramidase family protein [Acinetobacter piscicola]